MIGMIRSMFLMVATFYAVAVWANSAGMEVHVNDVYPALAFFASIVVAVLGWLLKTLVTRDRAAIDKKMCDVEENFQRRIDAIEIAHEKARLQVAKEAERIALNIAQTAERTFADLRVQINGIGVKLEHLADVVDEKVSEAVEELRRHDRELFEKWDRLNREFGQLKGEHDTLKEQHHRSWKKEGP